MDIGLFIAKERTKKNLSQAELAELVGCTRRAIEYWEDGQRNISLCYLDKLLKVLNVTIKIGHEGELF